MSDSTTRDGGERRGTGTARNRGLSRRSLVATGVATWATAGLAGCSDNDDGGDDGGTDTVTVTTDTSTTDDVPDDGTDEGTDDGNGGSTETDTPTDTTTPMPTTTACEGGRVFSRGNEVAFLVGVRETDTGAFLGTDRVEGVTVTFPDGEHEPLELSWDGRHDDHVDARWGGKLADTSTFAPGRYRYEVEVQTASSGLVSRVDEFSLIDLDR